MRAKKEMLESSICERVCIISCAADKEWRVTNDGSKEKRSIIWEGYSFETKHRAERAIALPCVLL